MITNPYKWVQIPILSVVADQGLEASFDFFLNHSGPYLEVTNRDGRVQLFLKESGCLAEPAHIWDTTADTLNHWWSIRDSKHPSLDRWVHWQLFPNVGQCWVRLLSRACPCLRHNHWHKLGILLWIFKSQWLYLIITNPAWQVRIRNTASNSQHKLWSQLWFLNHSSLYLIIFSDPDRQVRIRNAIVGCKHRLLELTLITTYIVAHIFPLRIRTDESGSQRAVGWSQQKPGSGHDFPYAALCYGSRQWVRIRKLLVVANTSFLS